MTSKHFVTLGFIVLSFFGFAQNTLVVGSAEYENAKISGTLDQYTLVYDLNSFQPVGNQVAPKKKPTTGKPKSGNCDCYQEPDATYTLAMSPNDDGSSGLITVPFNINFYGQNYNSFYINNNGNITFESTLSSFSSTAFPSAGNKIIAPFWADVDTRGGNGQVVYKITPSAVYINWEGVGYYSQQGDKLNTFQLIITDGTDPAVPDGNNVAFCYQDMQWTTGSASSGVNGFGGVPATCGANKGDNIAYFLISRFDHPGTDFDGALGNPDGISWLDNKSFFFDVTNSGNVPPIPEGVAACDTFKICSYGDTADISINFFAPEANQTTSITYTNGGLTSLQELANISGNTAQLILRVIGDASNAGTYNLTVTATDDFAPTPGITTMNFVIVIENDPSIILNPVFDYIMACESYDIAVLNGPYDSYLWDDFSDDPTLTVDETGEVGVTVRLGNCFKRIDTLIYVPQPANFDLTGNLYLCPGEDSTFVQVGDSANIDVIDWNLGDPVLDVQFHNWLQPGTYTISNMDSTGLCANDTTFSITMASAASIFGNAVECNGLNFQVSGATMGTDSQWSSPDPEITFSNTGIANPIITASTTGTYTVELSTPCVANLTAEVTFPPNPQIFDDTTLCSSQYQVTNTSSYQNAGIWTASSPNVSFSPSNTALNPQIVTSVSGSYIITYTDNICNNTDQANITMAIPPSIFSDDIGCNLLYQVEGTTSFDGGIWTASDTSVHFTSSEFVDDPLIWVSAAGNYTMTYTDNFCGISVSANVLFPPFAYTQVLDTTICLGSTYTIYALENSTVNDFTWNTGATGPSIDVTQPGDYIVTGYNICHTYTDTATIQVEVCDIEAPNVISLSSTVGNNMFFVQYEGVEKFTCTIVNRWGNKIYEYYDPSGAWDGRTQGGTAVEEGTYFYIIKAQFYGGEEVTKQGFVQVVH